jgi:hypothetical protein
VKKFKARGGRKMQQKINIGYINVKYHLRSLVGQDLEKIYLDILKS